MSLHHECVCVGQIILYGGGGFLSNFSDLDRITLGNFGLPSANNNSAQLGIELRLGGKGACYLPDDVCGGGGGVMVGS